MDWVRARFNHTKGDLGYQRLMKEAKFITGTWDDHDFGKNDGDENNPVKDRNREVYLEFLGEMDTERRL